MAIATVPKLTKEVKAFIVRAIQEVLTDPDFGLELSKKAKARLHHAASFKGKTTPFSEIRKKYYRS